MEQQTQFTTETTPTASEHIPSTILSQRETQTPATMAQARRGSATIAQDVVSLEHLLPRLRRLAAGARRRKAIINGSQLVLSFGLFIWYFNAQFGGKNVEFAHVFLYSFFYTIFFGFVAHRIINSTVGVYMKLRDRTDKRNIENLAQFDDVRVVGPLAEALVYKDRNLRKVVQDALTQLLPKLKASDAPLLSKEQRGYLHRALSRKDTELSFAILMALEQVGDANAIPFVQKLADGEGRARKNPKLQDAAERCLGFLEERLQYQEANETLLRASGSQSTAPEVLLRPVLPAPSDAQPQYLLRASNPTKER